MSLGGVTSALNARIAAGDFGGQRIFPAGTPVIITSIRGQLEVLLGNIPQLCVFLDNFERQESTPGLISYDDTAWVYDSGVGNVIPVTDGENLAINFTAANRLAYQYFDVLVGTVPDLLKKTEAFSFRARFKQSAITTNGIDTVRFEWYNAARSGVITFLLSLRSGSSTIRLVMPNEFSSSISIPTLLVDTWYIAHLDVKAGSYGRAKIYKEDDGPGDWIINLGETSNFDLSTSPLWDFTNELQNGYIMTRLYSDLKFCPPEEP
jgi:hypothetical protein